MHSCELADTAGSAPKADTLVQSGERAICAISCRERMHEYGQCRGSTSASVVERLGYAAGEALLLGAGLLSLAAMEVMALW
jgi:hypothetical protein